jgi:3'(2'), 5'-bisphosphate nucleotidase
LSDGPLEEAKRLPNRKAPASINELQNIESLKSTSMSHPSNKAVCDKLGVTYPGLDIWAQQMKYIALALGGWDLMVRVPKDAGHRGAAWDHASGQLICEEVGVVMTDLRGNKHDYSKGRRLYDNFGDVAAPIEWHGKVLEAVREVWKDGKASL